MGVVYMLGMCYTSALYPQSLFQIFIYMCEYLHVCICNMCVPSACRGHKKAKDPLEQELYMGARNGAQIFCRSTE